MAEYPHATARTFHTADTIVALSKDREFQCRMNPNKTISVFVCICGYTKFKHFAVGDFFDILKGLVT